MTVPRRCAPESAICFARNLGRGMSQRGAKDRVAEVGARRGFELLSRRWVAERTFAWLCHNRRMRQDYERLCATSEAFVYAAMVRLMVRRLVRA